MTARRRTLAALTTTALLGLAAPAAATATPAPEPATACAPGEVLEYVCDLSAPEDLVQVGDSRWIVASSLVLDPGSTGGGLSLIDSEERTATQIVPDEVAPRAPYEGCTEPPAFDTFSTHGLSIREDGDGRSTLFVVSHGAREVVEVFEVDSTGDGAPSFTWVGCVPAVAGAFNNSVVGLPDGRIVVTDFLQAPATFEDVLSGAPTGAVYVWEPGGAFEPLPGTELSGPNGVEVTPDLRHLLVAESGSSSVKRYQLAATEEPPVVITTDFRTDNLRFGPDGRLLLAGPRPDPSCAPEAEDCASTSVVAALDPRTMDLEVLLEVPPEAAFTDLTSALIVDDRLWLGSVAGDRVAHTAAPQLAGRAS